MSRRCSRGLSRRLQLSKKARLNRPSAGPAGSDPSTRQRRSSGRQPRRPRRCHPHRELEPRIRPGGSTDVREVFSAEFHHPPVNFHHVQLLDIWMAQALPCGAAVSPPITRIRSIELAPHSAGCTRPVVVAFLLLRSHPAAIQQQPPARSAHCESRDLLERTGLLDQNLSFNP